MVRLAYDRCITTIWVVNMNALLGFQQKKSIFFHVLMGLGSLWYTEAQKQITLIWFPFDFLQFSPIPVFSFDFVFIANVFFMSVFYILNVDINYTYFIAVESLPCLYLTVNFISKETHSKPNYVKDNLNREDCYEEWRQECLKPLLWVTSLHCTLYLKKILLYLTELA